MKLIRKLADFPEQLRGGALTIGNFDGVHLGHKVIIDQLKQFAFDENSALIVFTFDPHPVRILRPKETPPPLTWTCLLYTSPSPRDQRGSRMPSSA